MPRTLTMVSVGEALLDETGASPAPSGLAMSAALHAVRLGHAGIVVSRVGQDAEADTLLGAARALGINVDHVQHDPDLPTGRRWARRFGGGGAQIDERAAFDNLQWDHDLVDLAMRAHVIVTGALARRSGQTRSEIDRFVSEGRTALKVFDLINRDDDHFERREQLAMLELVDGVMIDRLSADVLVPARRGGSLRDAAREMMREFKLEFVIALDGNGLSLITRDDEASSTLQDGGAAQRELVLVAMMHFIAHGCSLAQCVNGARDIASHASSAEGGALPESLRAVT